MSSIVSLIPNPGNTIDGVFAHLQLTHPTNWMKYMNITPSTTSEMEGRDVYNIVNISLTDASRSSNWCSRNVQNSSITITFPFHFFVPTHFFFRTKTTDQTVPTSWYAEGSLTGNEWQKIGTYSDEFVLDVNDQNGTFRFDIIQKLKHLRFVHIDGYQNGQHTSCFCLRQLEIYGDLISSCLTCIRRNHFHLLTTFFLILVLGK